MKTISFKILLIVLMGSISFFVGCLEEPTLGPSFQEQLALDIEIIDDYLNENGIEALIHSSGIRYVHVLEGDGDQPDDGDFVVIKFKSKFFSQTIFMQDSIGLTIKLSDPTIVVMQTIIPIMREGGRMIVYAPSGYCYGLNSFNGAPKNTNFIFEIELISVINSESDQLLADIGIIDEYLYENNIESEIHSSEIRFTTLNEGVGTNPSANSQVFVKYKGSFLSGNVVDQNTTGVQFSLVNLIEAWKIMIPTMKPGGKIKMYAPSKYCYGIQGNSIIPPNTILAFEIELVSFN